MTIVLRYEGIVLDVLDKTFRARIANLDNFEEFEAEFGIDTISKNDLCHLYHGAIFSIVVPQGVPGVEIRFKT